MKFVGKKIEIDHTPLVVSGSLNVSGGSLVQFFDGTKYSPNREGVVSSPILLTHTISVRDPDSGEILNPSTNTTFYENDVTLSASSTGYELVNDNAVKVKKNIPANNQIVLKAVTEFLDSRSGQIYKREDFVTLRTILKAEAQYNLRLSPSNVVFFDGYRSPNVAAIITANLKHGNETITDFSDIEFRWLNTAGLDIVANELFATSISADGKELTIDKTYINKEVITCEVWKGGKLLDSSTVTYVRKFNSFEANIDLIGLPIQPGANTVTCTMQIQDTKGVVDVNAAFLLRWMVNEDGFHRQLGSGTPFEFTTSDVDMTANKVEIYPDLMRREAFAALTDAQGRLLTDENGKVLTAETFGD